MTTRTAAIEADLATVPDVAGIAPRTVVALPPSGGDDSLNGGGFGAFADQFAGTAPVMVAGPMRVYVNGVLTLREYDPDLEAN